VIAITELKHHPWGEENVEQTAIQAKSRKTESREAKFIERQSGKGGLDTVKEGLYIYLRLMQK